MRLIEALLDAPLDNSRSHLDCVLDVCAPPVLLAFSRCGWRLHLALVPSLQRVEQKSEADICSHLGMHRTPLTAMHTLTWVRGLPSAQCRHLGAWLHTGGPLQGVATLQCRHHVDNEDDEDGEEEGSDKEIDLLQLRCEDTVIIDLGNKRISNELLITIIYAMGSMAKLTYLYLNENLIGDEGMRAFADAIGNGSMGGLKRLDLIGNLIGDAGMIKFSEALGKSSMGKLMHLYLNNNQIGDPGMIELSRSVANGSMGALQELNLWGNQIGDAGIQAFADAIASGSLPALHTLSLSGNPGDGAPAWKALADRFK